MGGWRRPILLGQTSSQGASAGNPGAGTGITWTASLPAGTFPGDLLVVFVSSYNSGSTAVGSSPVSGWLRGPQGASGGGAQIVMTPFAKVATSADIAAGAVHGSFTVSQEWTALCARFLGMNLPIGWRTAGSPVAPDTSGTLQRNLVPVGGSTAVNCWTTDHTMHPPATLLSTAQNTTVNSAMCYQAGLSEQVTSVPTSPLAGPGIYAGVTLVLTPTSSYNPVADGNLFAWYTASEVDPGVSGSKWNDIYGFNSGDLNNTFDNDPTIQSNAINGRPAFKFVAASSQSIRGSLAPGAGDITVVCIMQTANSGINQCAYQIGPGGTSFNAAAFMRCLTGTQYGERSGGDFGTPTAVYADGVYRIWTVRVSSTTLNLYNQLSNFGGVTVSNPVAVAPLDIEVGVLRTNTGSINFLDGTIAELLVFNAALSTPRLTNVVGFLKNRYAL